jgi:diadenosine tetraphosphate (Ap4A) HIT family hydrolase
LGETVVQYKPHRDDMSVLHDEEAGRVMQMCVKMMNAIKLGLGAEKVYMITMCDGPINHLHFTLVPRYPGEHWGFRNFWTSASH